MPNQQHYSPELNRFLVCALYHEAKERGMHMTNLANQLLSQALTGGDGWQKAIMQYQEPAQEPPQP
jgi:hypothetical protein